MTGRDAKLTLPLRPFLGVLAALVLAVAIAAGPRYAVGVYSPLTVTAAVSAGLLLLAACTLPRRSWPLPPAAGRAVIVGAGLFLAAHTFYFLLDSDGGTPLWIYAVVTATALSVAGATAWRRAAPASFAAAVLGALALVLSGEAVYCTDLNPDVDPRWVWAVDRAALIGFVLTASLLLHLPGIRWRRLFAAQVVLLFVAGLVLRFGAAVASPNPGIDLYMAQQMGGDHLLDGEDPYGATYCFKCSPFYPPLPLLTGARVPVVRRG